MLKYRILRLASEGGMGRLYEAVRISDGRRVALKVLHDSLATNERFRRHMLREADTLVRAAHRSVVELLEVGETSLGLPYLALEWLDGRSLEKVIADDGPLSLATVKRIFLMLLDALEVVHSRGIIHADLKPDNIMIVPGRGGSEELRLIDFGVASVDRDQCAPQGEVYGTPGYLAPEVLASGAVSPASDLYAAGVILFELLTGCAPFVSASMLGLMQLHLAEEPPSPSEHRLGGGSQLDAVILRALAKTTAERYRTVDELRDAFLAATEPTLSWKRGKEAKASVPRPLPDGRTRNLRRAATGE